MSLIFNCGSSGLDSGSEGRPPGEQHPPVKTPADHGVKTPGEAPRVHALPGNPLCPIVSCHPTLFINLALTFPEQASGGGAQPASSPPPGTVDGPHSHKVGGLASSQTLPTRFNTSECLQLTSPGVFLNPGLGQPLCYIPVGQGLD